LVRRDLGHPLPRWRRRHVRPQGLRELFETGHRLGSLLLGKLPRPFGQLPVCLVAVSQALGTRAHRHQVRSRLRELVLPKVALVLGGLFRASRQFCDPPQLKSAPPLQLFPFSPHVFVDQDEDADYLLDEASIPEREVLERLNRCYSNAALHMLRGRAGPGAEASAGKTVFQYL